MHWARLEASALGSLIAACPAWKRREERQSDQYFFYRASHCILCSMLSPFLVYQPSPHWKSRIAHSGMHLPSVESTPRFIPSASPLMSRFTSSFTCQLISLIITTLIIHHSFALLLQAQNLPFQQILTTFIVLLPSAFTITGPDRTYHACRFILVRFFIFFLFVPCGGLNWLHVSFFTAR